MGKVTSLCKKINEVCKEAPSESNQVVILGTTKSLMLQYEKYSKARESYLDQISEEHVVEEIERQAETEENYKTTMSRTSPARRIRAEDQCRRHSGGETT